MFKQADKMALVLVFSYLLFLFYKYPSTKDNRAIIHDVTSYYGYLPAHFIYHDIDFGFADTMPPGEPLDALWYNALPNGQRFQKMTLGLSYFYAPSFFLADVYAKKSNQHNRNGFSKPYQWAMAWNTLLIGMLSAFVLLYLLRHFFSPLVTGIVLLLIFGTSNLAYYISMAPGLSHPYSFLLLCLQFLLTLRLLNKPQNLYLLFFVGLVTSWLVLIRPTNLIPALLPLFVLGWRGVLNFFLLQPKNLLLLCVGALLPWLPQFLYWYHVSGHIFFYSYDQERFFFADPKIWEGLFGFRKGWFVYTPIAFVSLFGLAIKEKHAVVNRTKWFVIATLPVFLLVVFSWWCWWYGGSYGSRVMIEYYVALAVLLGLVVKRCLNTKWLKSALVAMGLFLGLLTHTQLKQYAVGLLHWDSMTWPAYKAIFMRTKLPLNYESLLKTPDYEAAKKGNRD